MKNNITIWYIVTKGSEDGTFQKGDHIKFCENGDILCKEAMGCIPKEEVKEATKGVEYEVDKEWKESQKKMWEEFGKSFESLYVTCNKK